MNANHCILPEEKYHSGFFNMVSTFAAKYKPGMHYVAFTNAKSDADKGKI